MQKLDEVQDTELSRLPGSIERGEVHDVPLKARTLPLPSAAMQKLDEVQDTELS
jgi:hypothetical protein